MFPITGSEFFIRVKGNPIFKKEDIEVSIYVYFNSVCFRYFTISTKDPIWENPFDLFDRLENQKDIIDIIPNNKEKNTFMYFFINSKTGLIINENNLITNMENLSI